MAIGFCSMCGERKDLLLAGWVCDTCSEILHSRTPTAEAMDRRINDVITVLEGGQVESARDRFIQLWKEIENTDDHLNLCKLAQCIGRVQEKLRDRISWNLRALQEAAAITDAELQQVSDASAEGYIPLTARSDVTPFSVHPVIEHSPHSWAKQLRLSTI